MRRPMRFAAFIAVIAGTLAMSGPAFASTVTIPSTNPFSVPTNSLGQPVPFTVSASGFTPGQPVFVEQCDGVPSTAVTWSPISDCDLGSSPSSVIADANGRVTFPAGDANRQFHPFRGASPQGLFNCLNSHDPSPNNGAPDFTNCQIRVSSNNTATTTDQVFITLNLGNGFGQTLAACSGFEMLGKYSPALAHTDATVTEGTSVLKDLGTAGSPAIGGSCSTNVAAFPTMHPKTIAAKLSGIATCNASQDAGAYPLNGKMTINMTEINTTTAKPYQLQAYLRVAGVDPSAPDVVDVSGIVTKGVAVGASLLGSVAQDAVTKVSPAPKVKPVGFTGYSLDSAKAAACQAGTGTIDTAQLSTGTSMLGGFATGLQFGF